MRLALLLVVAACSSSAPAPPSNVAANDLDRDPPASLGALAIAPARADSDALPSFVPVAPYALVDTARRTQGVVRAIDARGTAGSFTANDAVKIAYGCDGNQLEVTPLAGPVLAPGVAWLYPAAIDPRAVAIRTIESTPARIVHAIGTVTVTAERDRTSPATAAFAIDVAGRRIHDSRFERTLMEGADPSMATLDLAAGGPGIPRPVGAWSFDDHHVIAFERPGWEGTTLEAWLVERAKARRIDAMTVYLYQCAF